MKESENESINLDETDIRLLNILQKNSKYTTKELADRIHLSQTPTFERQRRLERLGIIDRYIAMVNPKRAGNGIMVLCNVCLKQHSQKFITEFMDAVQHIDDIVECYNISGEYDFLIKVYVRDMEQYQDFVLNTLGVIDCIGSIHSVFVYGMVKTYSGIPIRRRDESNNRR